MANTRPYRMRQSRPAQNVFGFDEATFRQVFVELDEQAERALMDFETLIYQAAGERAVSDLRARANRMIEASASPSAARNGVAR